MDPTVLPLDDQGEARRLLGPRSWTSAAFGPHGRQTLHTALGACALALTLPAVACTPDYTGFVRKGTGGAGGQPSTSGAGGQSTSTSGAGGACSVDAECHGQVCLSGLCVDSCADLKQDFNETDVDCGGPKCGACDNLKACVQDSDCKSKVCKDHGCIAASCSDGIKDQNETDVDCGGVCAPASLCAPTKGCLVAGDCESYLCNATSSKCDPVNVVAQGAMIADMEDGSTNILPLGGRAGTWYGFADSSSVPSPPPSTNTLIPGGRGTSSRAIHVSGQSVVSYAGIGFDLNNTAGSCGGKTYYSAATYAGVEFWVRGDVSSTVRLNVVDWDTWEGCGSAPPAPICGSTNDAGGCDDHFGKTVTISKQWVLYKVLFTSMQQSSFGEQFSALNLNKLISIQFALSAGAGAYDFWIDDVAFF